MLHSYHFKLNNVEHNDLLEIMKSTSITKKSKLVSFFIIKGFKHIKFIMDSLKNQLTKKPKDNNRIKDIRVKLRLKHYRLFKSYHSSFNTFSIAMIIRAFVKIFTIGIKKHGTIEKFLEVLKKSKELLKNKIFNYEFKKIHIKKILIINKKIIIKFLKLLSEHLIC